MAANPIDINPQNVAQAFKEYKWCNSHSMNFEIQIGLRRLEMATDIKASDSSEVPEDIYFSAYIVCNQLAMHETPVSTHFSVVDEPRNNLIWDCVLSFPVKIRDLSLDSLLVLTAFTPNGEVYGGTTMNFFDEFGKLKNGKQKLMFFFGLRGDPNVIPALNKTPGELYDHYFKLDYKFQMEKHYETFKANLHQIRSTKQENKLEWLDRLMLTRIQESLGIAVNPYDFSTSENEHVPPDNTANSLEELDLQTFCFVVIEMPYLQVPILHEEKQYPAVTPHVLPTSMLELLAPCIVEMDENIIEFALVGRVFNASMITMVADWDMDQENLSEDMNRRLNQNARRGESDATAKPNLAEKEKIDRIIQSINNHMTVEEIDLLYRFRYSLTENKKTLTKFLFSVNWEAESEVAELPTLFALWTAKAPIDVADALRLLSKEKSFEHPLVREYAVGVLRSASDEELLTFLLQLVQALRYEPTPSAPAATVPVTVKPGVGAVDFAMENSIVGIDHLKVSGADVAIASKVSAMPTATAVPIIEGTSAGLATSGGKESPKVQHINATPASSSTVGNLSPLANFLIDRACNSPTVANYLYWYLKVEIEDEQSGELFDSIFQAFIVQLAQSGHEQSLLFKRLLALDDYIAKISGCQRDAREVGGKKDKKEAGLQKLLVERQLEKISPGVDWVPMPLEPKIKLIGLNASSAMMFASAVYPCVIEFYEYVPPVSASAIAATSTGDHQVVPTAAEVVKKPKTHKIMFKSGDDLRQDQLIMQMIALMDRLLKKVNLDLKLLTYGILAVGQRDGIMEFVRNSMAISGVMKKHGSITEYLKIHNPDKSGPFEMSAVALDTFVKSCAGYCVITYILGIGDRHLDNIMVNTSGQMFHIDFGFIFGQDPKPLPPPFRLTRSMADAMGGEESEHYARFKSFCCQSYNWLRKSAHLVLNLINLMGDAGIQDISKRSELPKVLMKVEEKFRLDLTDEQAEQFFLTLINESLHSLAPKVMEGLHMIAVSMR